MAESSRSRLSAVGVARMHDNDRAVLVCFGRKPTDDELRAVHDLLRDSPDWVKERTVGDFFRCLDNRVIPPVERREAMRALAIKALTQSETGMNRNAVIEEVAKSIEAAPLTYMGPDPGGVRDLKFLIVAAIRDMKGRP